MNEHPIIALMDTTIRQITQMVDSNTIMGEALKMPDGTIILPISKISFGFATGGSDLPTKAQNDQFGGGAGAGVSVVPVGFLVVSGKDVRLIQIADTSNNVDRLIGTMPDMVDKVGDLFRKDKNKKESEK